MDMSSQATQDKFSPDTYTVIGLAKKSVLEYKHQYITPEHILLGLVACDSKRVGEIFAQAKATPDQMRALLAHHLRKGDSTLQESELTFSERAKRVIEAAKAEAVRAGTPQVGPEHLLIGLTSVTNTVCGAVLRAVGITTESVRKSL